MLLVALTDASLPPTHRAAMPWPGEDRVFRLPTRDGLFLCRNHPFFTSCVPTNTWPGELAAQEPFLRIRYPRLPRPLLERVVGFFDLIGDLHGSEAAVLLAWDPHRRGPRARGAAPDRQP
jgi:hypothetical protein